jgi:hypothetical protein
MVGKPNTVLYQEPLYSWYTFNEIYRVYGNNERTFSSVTLWCKKFKREVDSVKDAPPVCRPKSATSPRMVKKVKD